MDAQTIVLPICTVQHDFQAVMRDVLDGIVPEDNFWLSCYKLGEPSVHGKVVASLDEHDRNLLLFEGLDGVQFKQYRQVYRPVQHVFSAACPGLNIKETRIATPSNWYSNPPEVRKPSQITAFDVAPDGSQFVTGYHDGSVHIRPASSPTALPSGASRPHLSTVTSLQFFPSSRVVLTAGADFSLSILPTDPPDSTSYTTKRVTSARTLRGHTRAVTSTAIVSRGRNVLSGSKDGTIRLWDMPSGSQIRTLAAGSNHFVPVLALSVGERWVELKGGTDQQSGSEDVDPREVETTDKVVFCALQDGSFEAFDLRTKRAVFRSSVGSGGARSALQTLAYIPKHNLLATGSASGLISVYDVRTLGGVPLSTFRRNEAPIEDLALVDLSTAGFGLPSSPSSIFEDASGTLGLAIAPEDGLPYVVDLRPSGPRVLAELVGTDCDAVRFVRVAGRDIWSAADDGVVRRYKSE
ncbi:WD40 repeat-like protein [Trametes punicea]|nr:WD40 repeat-like protein [Trametes punicea]